MRKLTMKKERLAELTTDDLSRVSGGISNLCLSVAVCVPTLHGCTTGTTCP